MTTPLTRPIPLSRHLRDDLANMQWQLDAMEAAITLMRERLFYSLSQVAESLEQLEERQSRHEEAV